MNQIKIGEFIAKRRKQVNLTQLQLAQQLGITDRAVSKWETGRSLPDASLMLDLCRILQIQVNELLSGEVLEMEDYNKELERHVLELVKEKEANDKRLLRLEIVIGVVSVFYGLTLCLLAAYLPMADWLRGVLLLVGMVPMIVSLCFALRIEQVAGYYECKLCKHRYVPTYRDMARAMHMGRTRYMRCPECQQRSWQKKVLTRE